MTSKIGKICILAGTMMILAAGLLLLKNQHQAETAGQAAAAAFLEIQQTEVPGPLLTRREFAVIFTV